MIPIHHRIPRTVRIQISALHDGGDIRGVGIGLQAQLVRALVDLLRLVAIEPVRRVPVGVLLRKPARPRAVIPCAEVVRAGLTVKILPAVAEGIRVGGIRILLHTEGVVGILKRN